LLLALSCGVPETQILDLPKCCHVEVGPPAEIGDIRSVTAAKTTATRTGIQVGHPWPQLFLAHPIKAVNR
jgi:hypothetical protein